MKAKFPSQEDIKTISKKLSKGAASATLPPNASDLEKLKYEICKAFVRYKQIHGFSQRDLAKELGINESIVSKVLHYKIESFTVDRLMRFLEKIESKVSVKVKVA